MSPSLSPGGALQPFGPALVCLWQPCWHLDWLVPSLFMWEDSQGSTLMISLCPTGVRCGSAKTGIPPPLSSIYTWGSGITTPLRLPMLNTEVVQVSAGRTQKAGVTKSGRLILWEVSDREPGAGSACARVISVKETFLLTRRPWHFLLQACSPSQGVGDADKPVGKGSSVFSSPTLPWLPSIRLLPWVLLGALLSQEPPSSSSLSLCPAFWRASLE